MITSRDRVIRALNHEPVDRVPRDLWATPAMETLRADELAEMLYRYPNDIIRTDVRHPRAPRAKGAPHETGQYTDAWGCVWQVAPRGATGEPSVGRVGNPSYYARHGAAGEQLHWPLADLQQLATYQPPVDLLDKESFAAAGRGAAATARFVLAPSDVRPLERLKLLHGTEATLTDLASGAKPIRDLLAMLHDFSCRELALWAATEVDGVALADDWGTPEGLVLPPQVFRDVFKPLYREYCDILRAADKFVFFQSAGNIEPILDDLVETGLDAIGTQLFLMNMESIARRFRNRVTFWAGLNQERLRSDTPDDLRIAVRRIRSALDLGHGGLIAQCQWSPEIPFRNIAAVLEQ